MVTPIKQVDGKVLSRDEKAPAPAPKPPPMPPAKPHRATGRPPGRPKKAPPPPAPAAAAPTPSGPVPAPGKVFFDFSKMPPEWLEQAAGRPAQVAGDLAALLFGIPTVPQDPVLKAISAEAFKEWIALADVEIDPGSLYLFCTVFAIVNGLGQGLALKAIEKKRAADNAPQPSKHPQTGVAGPESTGSRLAVASPAV